MPWKMVCRELTIGLGMKVLLANQMADLWEKIRAVGYESISTPLAWLGIVAFSFEIYFDFYGYSLMAIGLGEMFGFHLPKNFQYPYGDFHDRFLASLAYDTGKLVQRLCVYPAGRQSLQQRENDPESAGSVAAHWIVAWCRLELSLWGFLLFVLVTVEKLCLLKSIPTCSDSGTCIYDSGHPPVMADICHL